MCECFKIGGRFIAEDPDCPEHGIEAQVREEQRKNPLRTELHSVVVTGDEPHGGVTLTMDLGKSFSRRYLCVEIPKEALPSLIEALAKEASK